MVKPTLNLELNIRRILESQFSRSPLSTLHHFVEFQESSGTQNTDIYITIKRAIFDERNDEFQSATAKTVEETKLLIETGFKYVCTYNDMMPFRKRKQKRILFDVRAF